MNYYYEDKSLFKHLNIDEEHFDLVIIGKKVMKQQIDTIKNEILQKTVCSIQHVIFEYEELLDDTIEVQFDYHNITINGTKIVIQFNICLRITIGLK